MSFLYFPHMSYSLMILLWKVGVRILTPPPKRKRTLYQTSCLQRFYFISIHLAPLNFPQKKNTFNKVMYLIHTISTFPVLVVKLFKAANIIYAITVIINNLFRTRQQPTSRRTVNLKGIYAHIKKTVYENLYSGEKERRNDNGIKL